MFSVFYKSLIYNTRTSASIDSACFALGREDFLKAIPQKTILPDISEIYQTFRWPITHLPTELHHQMTICSEK